MNPFLNTPDVIVQREKTHNLLETGADGAEVITHNPPPGSGWHYVDGDSAKASWARLLTPVVDDDEKQRTAVIVQASQAHLPENTWSVVVRRKDGATHELNYGLHPTIAFGMANAIHLAFGVALELPSGFEPYVQAMALMIGD